MSIVAEFDISLGALPGEGILRELTDATVRLERLVPVDGAIEVFFWVVGVDADDFLEIGRGEPGIDDVRMLARLDQGVLFRATWEPESAVVDGIKTLRGTIVAAVGTVDGWSFQVVAEDRERLRAFQRAFSEQGVDVELKRVTGLNGGTADAAVAPALTDQQRRTLLVAYREGYFDQPRGITQAELGELFGVTGRAVSNRLRRGTRNLIARTLLEPNRWRTW